MSRGRSTRTIDPASLLGRTSAEAIADRVHEAHDRRTIREQAERLAADQAAVEAHASDDRVSDSRQQRRALDRRRRKLAARELRLLRRDEAVVREVLARKGPLEGIMSAAGSTPCDELMWFLVDRLGLLPALEGLAPPAEYRDPRGKAVRRREMFSPAVLNSCGLMARWLGCESGGETQAAVLCDERWMGLLGFNLAEVRDGTTRRSVGLRGKTRDDAHRFVDADEAGCVRERPEEPKRGALSVQTLAEHESSLEAAAVTRFFNEVVRALVRTTPIRGKREGIIDTTLIEVPPSFPGGGTTRRKVKVKSKARRPKTADAHVYGFKLWTLMDARTGLPLALILDTAEKPDNLHVLALVEQAQRNLGESAHLTSVVLDRGFLDGDLLHRLVAEAKLDWVVPAKAGMEVTAEARERVTGAILGAARQGESVLETARRLARSSKKVDSVRFFERSPEPGRAPLVVAQVDDLHCTDFYGPGGSDSSRLNSKSFRCTPLYGTVVLSWPDRSSSAAPPPEDCDEEAGPGPAVLLSPRPEAALVRFDRYDRRSLIENLEYRDGKQYFGLGKSLARTRQALFSAAVFSTVALALHRALAAHTEAQEERARGGTDRRAPRLGVLRYRRLIEMRNRDLIIIVAEGCYAILEFREFAAYAGFELR